MAAARARRVGSKYLLGDLIGEGTTGVAHRGQIEATGEAVAIKLLRPDLAQDDEVVVRFVKERRFLSQLTHPNVVDILDLVVEGDTLAVVTELVVGDDLASIRGRVPPAEAVDLSIDVADGLAAIHSLGLVHRNLNPASVLLSGAPGAMTPKIDDFGLAHLVGGTSRSGELAQRIPYRAPETRSGAEAVSAKADIYSLGVLLVELIDGALPTEQTGPPVGPRGGPPELVELVAEMTRAAPDERPELNDVRSRLDAVREALRRPPPTSPPTEPETIEVPIDGFGPQRWPVEAASTTNRFGGPARPVSRLRSLVIATMAGVGALGLILGAWSVFGPDTDDGPETAADGAQTLGSESSAAPTDLTPTTRPPLPDDAEVFGTGVGEIGIPADIGTADQARLALLLIDEVRANDTEHADQDLNRLRVLEGRARNVLSAIDEQSRCCGAVQFVAYHPSGDTLVSGGSDGVVRVWQPETGESIAQFDGHRNEVRSVAFHPEGDYLVSSSFDGQLIAWDLESGRERWTIEGPGTDGDPDWRVPQRSVAIAPSGSVLASGGNDGVIRLWDPETQELLDRVEGHTSTVQTVTYSPDGEILASGGVDGRIVLWDAATLDEITTLIDLDRSVDAVDFDPTGFQLAAASDDGRVRVWDVRSETVVQDLPLNSGVVNSVQYGPDGEHLVVASGDGGIRVLSVDRGTIEASLTGNEGAAWHATFSPDGRSVSSASNDGTVRTWDWTTGEQLARSQGHLTTIWRLATSPDGSQIASTAGDGNTYLWDQLSRAEDDRLRGHDGWALGVAYSPDGDRLATVGADQRVRLWTRSGEVVATLADQGTWLWTTAYSPDGDLLVAGGQRGVLLVHNGRTGRVIARLPDIDSEIRKVTFSPDGAQFATASLDGQVRVWDADTLAQVTTIPAHERALSVDFSPDGRFLATSGSDGRARIWNTVTGAQVAELPSRAGARPSSNLAVRYSDDGQLLLMTDREWIVIFDLETEEVVSTIDFGTAMRDVILSSDGRMVVAAGIRSMRYFDLATAIAPACQLVDLDRFDADALVPYLPPGHQWSGC